MLQISLLLPDKMCSENLLRVYCKRPEVAETAREIFPRICKKLGLTPFKVDLSWNFDVLVQVCIERVMVAEEK